MRGGGLYLLAIVAFFVIVAASGNVIRKKRVVPKPGAEKKFSEPTNIDEKARNDCKAKGLVFSEKFNKCCEKTKIVHPNTGECIDLVKKVDDRGDPNGGAKQHKTPAKSDKTPAQSDKTLAPSVKPKIVKPH